MVGDPLKAAGLDPVEASVLRLRAAGGTLEETAATLGMPSRAVRRAQHRAMEKLARWQRRLPLAAPTGPYLLFPEVEDAVLEGRMETGSLPAGYAEAASILGEIRAAGRQILPPTRQAASRQLRRSGVPAFAGVAAAVLALALLLAGPFGGHLPLHSSPSIRAAARSSAPPPPEASGREMPSVEGPSLPPATLTTRPLGGHAMHRPTRARPQRSMVAASRMFRGLARGHEDRATWAVRSHSPTRARPQRSAIAKVGLRGRALGHVRRATSSSSPTRTHRRRTTAARSVHMTRRSRRLARTSHATPEEQRKLTSRAERAHIAKPEKHDAPKHDKHASKHDKRQAPKPAQKHDPKHHDPKHRHGGHGDHGKALHSHHHHHGLHPPV